MDHVEHVLRENALITSRNALAALYDLTDDRRFLTAGLKIADMLADHRASEPGLNVAVEEAWRWAEEQRIRWQDGQS